MTEAIFRKFPDGDIIAIFPYEICNLTKGFVSSYMKVGQHGAASLDLIQDTVPATEEEYSELKQELENLGYDDLVVKKRVSHNKHREAWNKAKLEFLKGEK